MGLTFTAVAPGNKTGDFNFDDEFVQEFFEAWDYLSQNPDKYLETEFSSSQYRETWLEKAKAYGMTKPKGEEIVVRRIKRTGSSDPNTGHLSFTMEAKSVADARHARLRAEAEDRKQRRANGEEIKRGKRRTSGV